MSKPKFDMPGAGPTTDDDVYVQDGESFQAGIFYPDTPAEQKAEEQTQAAIQAASYPILDDIREWFRVQIEGCDDINNIEVGSLEVNGVKYSRAVSIEAQVLAFQLIKQKMQEKADEFKVEEKPNA